MYKFEIFIKYALGEQYECVFASRIEPQPENGRTLFFDENDEICAEFMDCNVIYIKRIDFENDGMDCENGESKD